MVLYSIPIGAQVRYLQNLKVQINLMLYSRVAQRGGEAKYPPSDSKKSSPSGLKSMMFDEITIATHLHPSSHGPYNSTIDERLAAATITLYRFTSLENETQDAS